MENTHVFSLWSNTYISHSHILVTMHDTTILLLDPLMCFLQRSFDLPFNGVHFIARKSHLPFHLWIIPPWLDWKRRWLLFLLRNSLFLMMMMIKRRRVSWSVARLMHVFQHVAIYDFEVSTAIATTVFLVGWGSKLLHQLMPPNPFFVLSWFSSSSFSSFLVDKKR